MPTYKTFEELPVWNAAIELGVRLFELTDHPSFRYKGDLVNQLRRAVLSISNNVAEGFERGTTNELITFLYIARGSAGEVRSMLRFALRLGALAPCHAHIQPLAAEAESVSRQLRGWLDTLQNSDIEGQRRLNDQTRRAYDNRHRVTVFERQQAEFKARMEEGLRNGTWGRPQPEISNLKSEISNLNPPGSREGAVRGDAQLPGAIRVN